MKTRGFTMVELIVVVAIVGILAVSAVPRMLSRNDLNQRGFVDKTLSTLRYARSMAIATRHYVCVSVNTANAPNASPPSPNLRVTVDNTAIADGATGFPACPATALPLAARDSNCAGTDNASCAQAGTTVASTVAAVVFDAAGRPSSSGTITITGGGSSSTVSIHQETGYVSSP